MPVFQNIPNFVFGSTPESIAAQENQMVDNARMAEAQALQTQQVRQQAADNKQRMLLSVVEQIANNRQRQSQNQSNYMLELAKIKAADAQRQALTPYAKENLALATQKQKQYEQQQVVKSLESAIADSTSPIDEKGFVQAYSDKLPVEHLSRLKSLIQLKNQDFQREAMRAESAANVINRPLDLQDKIEREKSMLDSIKDKESDQYKQHDFNLLKYQRELADAEAQRKMLDRDTMALVAINSQGRAKSILQSRGGMPQIQQQPKVNDQPGVERNPANSGLSLKDRRIQYLNMLQQRETQRNGRPLTELEMRELERQVLMVIPNTSAGSARRGVDMPLRP